MSNNFGTGGYSQGQNAQAAKMAAMVASYSNPYSGIASFLVGRAAQNIGGSIDDSHKNNQQIVTQGKGDINAQHSSPFGVSDEMGSQMMPGAEKMLSANTKPLEVAPASFTFGPADVDSKEQPYKSSLTDDYLNYMKYQGGYKL